MHKPMANKIIYWHAIYHSYNHSFLGLNSDYACMHAVNLFV